MSASLTFLGTADSKGVPRFWCQCGVCTEARTTGVNRRTRTAHLLRGPDEQGREEVALLDCGTDLHAQLSWLATPLVPDAVFISHAHNDHLLGLADLLDFASYEGGRIKVYAPESVIPQIEDRFGYAFRREAPVQPIPTDGVSVAGFTVQLFPVPHGANGTSHAYLFTRPGWRGAVVTDSIGIPPELWQTWLTGLDFLALGTSFTDESAHPPTGRSVYDIREALELPWAQAARRVYLTHLSHGVDVARVSLPPNWAFAHDGLRVAL